MKPEKNFMIDDILNVLTDLLKFRDYLNLSSNSKKNQKLWKRIWPSTKIQTRRKRGSRLPSKTMELKKIQKKPQKIWIIKKKKVIWV